MRHQKMSTPVLPQHRAKVLTALTQTLKDENSLVRALAAEAIELLTGRKPKVN